MKSKFIVELERGVSVIIEAESVEEAKTISAKNFGKTLQDNMNSEEDEKKTSSPKSLYNHLLRLKDEGFFSEPRTLNDIRQRLKELAVHYPATTFPAYLNRLIQERIIRRFQENKEGKKFWVYVNV